MKRKLHRFFAFFGIIPYGHLECIRHGCADYCGTSPSQAVMFIGKKCEIGIAKVLKENGL